VVWFFIAEILRGKFKRESKRERTTHLSPLHLPDFWLAPPYGRNWTYLWKNPDIPVWATAILVIVFFVFIWAGALAVLTRSFLSLPSLFSQSRVALLISSLPIMTGFAKVHSWLLPIFAIGLGAPRW